MLVHSDSQERGGPIHAAPTLPTTPPAATAAVKAPVTPLADVTVGDRTLWTDPRR